MAIGQQEKDDGYRKRSSDSVAQEAVDHLALLAREAAISKLPKYVLSVADRADILAFAKMYQDRLSTLVEDSFILSHQEITGPAVEEKLSHLDRILLKSVIDMIARAVDVNMSEQEKDLLINQCSDLIFNEEFVEFVLNHINNTRDENKFIRREYEGITYVVPTWEQMADATAELAKKIIESEQEYDLIVALAKGGLTWSRLLANYVEMETIAAITVKLYEDIGRTTDGPKISFPLAVSLRGLRILVVDEVADSGQTLIAAIDHLRRLGATIVHSAVLCLKPQSRYKSTYSAFETSHWVIFPHEDFEAAVQLIKTWRKQGLLDVEIVERLKALDLPTRLKLFLKETISDY